MAILRSSSSMTEEAKGETLLKRMLKRLICLGLMVCLLPTGAAGEDEEISLEDTAGIEIEEEILYDEGEGPEWTFPVALEDMDPRFIRLANKEILLESTFAPEPLVTMKTRKKDKDGSNANGGVNKASSAEMQLQKDCAEALVTMFEAALEEDITLYLKSAYRSYRTQKTMYYNRLEKNNGKDDGWVSKPGASDHQTGLGADIVPRSWRDKSMNEKMASAKECQWMAENCADYGFILRYPEDKQDVTEINYEPWHLRYVGESVARYIMDNGLCLEEFHQELQAAIDEFLALGGNERLVREFIQTSAEE